jgi:hypothetical protein
MPDIEDTTDSWWVWVVRTPHSLGLGLIQLINFIDGVPCYLAPSILEPAPPRVCSLTSELHSEILPLADGVVAKMNTALHELFPPIHAPDKYCYVMHNPTATWMVS